MQLAQQLVMTVIPLIVLKRIKTTTVNNAEMLAHTTYGVGNDGMGTKACVHTNRALRMDRSICCSEPSVDLDCCNCIVYSGVTAQGPAARTQKNSRDN